MKMLIGSSNRKIKKIEKDVLSRKFLQNIHQWGCLHPINPFMNLQFTINHASIQNIAVYF